MERFARKHMAAVLDAAARLASDPALGMAQRQCFQSVMRQAKAAARAADPFAVHQANAVAVALCAACRATWTAYDPQCPQRCQWFEPCALVKDYSVQ